MKNILAFLLTLFLLLMLVSCSSGTDKDARIAELEAQVEELESQLQAKENSETIAAPLDNSTIISDKTDDSNADESPKEFQKINLGETITFDWAEFTLDSVEWVNDVLPSNTSGYYSYYKGTDGEIHLVIRGTWKNTSGESYDIGDIKSQFVINDRYKYTGSATREDDDGGGFSPFALDPLKKINFIIYTSVPNEAKEMFEVCKLTFGFGDNMENSILSKLEELNNVYELEVK